MSGQEDVLLANSSTPVYVEILLEDGRSMIIPAQTIQPAQPSAAQALQQPLQQQSLQQSQQNIIASQPRVQTVQSNRAGRYLPPDHITIGGPRLQQMLSRPGHCGPQRRADTSATHRRTDTSGGSHRQRTTPQNIDIAQRTTPQNIDIAQRTTPQNIDIAQRTTPQNIDITNLVQSISIEPYSSNSHQQPTHCMMECGSDGLSKGSNRLVTDARCNHTACLTCIMKAPTECPVCRKEQSESLGRQAVLASAASTKAEPPTEATFECKVCCKAFKRGGDLIRHERVCHGINTGAFTCPTCNKNFLRAFDLKRHISIHNAEKKFVCGKCGAKFNRCENMKRHLLGHSGARPYQCAYCKKEFTQQENLKRHILTHTGEYQRYRCGECKKDFTRLASLRRHEHRHTGSWPFTCVECEPHRGFSEPGLYKKHRLTHKGIKPYVCKLCNKGFNNPKAYRNHRRVHTGERPYVCHVCSGTFSQWGHLKRHKKVHDKEQAQDFSFRHVHRHLISGSYRRSSWNKRHVDPGKPKLPLSAYFLWFMDARERILKANPQLKMPELAKAGGKLWKTVNKEEKEFYEKKAVLERQRYKEQLEAYSEKKRLRRNIALYPAGCHDNTSHGCHDNASRATTDVCVGTDGELPRDKTKFTMGGRGGAHRNLLESAGRSVGLHPPENYPPYMPTTRDVTMTTRDVTMTTRDVTTSRDPPYLPYRSVSSTFSRPSLSFAVNPSNPNVAEFPVLSGEGGAVSAGKINAAIYQDTLPSNPHSARDVTLSNPHSARDVTLPARYDTFSRYPDSDYPFTSSPPDILDFTNTDGDRQSNT